MNWKRVFDRINLIVVGASSAFAGASYMRATMLESAGESRAQQREAIDRATLRKLEAEQRALRAETQWSEAKRRLAKATKLCATRDENGATAEGEAPIAKAEMIPTALMPGAAQPLATATPVGAAPPEPMPTPAVLPASEPAPARLQPNPPPPVVSSPPAPRHEPATATRSGSAATDPSPETLAAAMRAAIRQSRAGQGATESPAEGEVTASEPDAPPKRPAPASQSREPGGSGDPPPAKCLPGDPMCGTLG